MNKEAIAILREETENTYGKKVVSSKDCLVLSEDVYHKTGFKINSNTLRRFFGLVKSNYGASPATLDILLKYCGCNSLSEISIINQRNNSSLGVTQAAILPFLLNIFENSNSENTNNLTFPFFVKHTIIFVNRNPQIIDQFQREIARTKNGRNFYYEKFINIDKLTSYFGQGLRYYLNEKGDAEAKIFGHSLLAFQFWLTGEDDKLRAEFQNVNENNLRGGFHPFICGRYFATSLYYYHSRGIDTKGVLINAFTFWNELSSKERHNNFPCFEFTLSEALILTGHYNEGLFYIEKALKNLPKNLRYLEVGYLEKFKLWQAFAFANMGEDKKCKAILADIKCANFFFLSKKYSNILLLILKSKFTKGKKNEIVQLKALIEETGFKRLSSCYRNMVVT